MVNEKLSLGQAIDQTLHALTPLDENARLTVLTAVCMQLGINFSERSSGVQNRVTATTDDSSSPSPPKVVERSSIAPSPSSSERVDIRSLKDQKKPKSARQMACLVAYYLQELVPEADRQETISTPDLEKYFKQAGYRLPEKLPQVLIDCKNAGYFDAPSRGNYKLNAVGHNLVVHSMPVALGS